jgi:hypothetical protein
MATRQFLASACALVLATGVGSIGCGGTDGDFGLGGIGDDGGDASTGTDGSSSGDSSSSSDGGDATMSDAPLGDSMSSDGGTSDSANDADAASDAANDVNDAASDASDASDAGGCPSPTAGSVYVAPTGSDTTGNGSQTCPYVTITKALSTTLTASGATTIFVQSGNGSANVYGSGCTAGGSSCDPTPIHVTDGMNKGIVIRGTSVDSTLVVVRGGVTVADTSVFLVSPPNVGFQNLTVSPRAVATGSGVNRVAGAAGIFFQAPAASGAEATVTNVIIDGIAKTNNTESTGSGIAMQGGTSPTVGPGVTIVGGDHSVLVTQAASGAPAVASKPIITSSAAAPSFFHSSQFACVRVESANASATATPTATLTATTAADPGRLHLQDCGGNGGVVVDTVKVGTAVDVTDTLIDTSGNGVLAFYGMRLQHLGGLKAGASVTITGINEVSVGVGAGIEATDSSALTIVSASTGVVVVRNPATGVHVGGNAVAKIDGLTSTNNRNGVFCDATAGVGTAVNLTLRNSVLLENRTFGAFVGMQGGSSPCVADLGNPNSVGNNIYNRTSRKNAFLGLCYLPAIAATASTSTWGCGLSNVSACAAAATPSAPTPIVVGQCDQIGDYNTNAALTVALPQTCCGL